MSDFAHFFPFLLNILPLFIVVLAAVIIAFANLHLGRPAQLVIVGGCLVLLSMIIGNAMTFMIMSGRSGVSIYNPNNGVLSMIMPWIGRLIPTIGWALIVSAVFTNREKSPNKL